MHLLKFPPFPPLAGRFLPLKSSPATNLLPLSSISLTESPISNAPTSPKAPIHRIHPLSPWRWLQSTKKVRNPKIRPILHKFDRASFSLIVDFLHSDNGKDMKSVFGPGWYMPSPSPSLGSELLPPMTPRRIITNSGRTLAFSNSSRRLDLPIRSISTRANKSFSNLQDLDGDAYSELNSPPMTPATPSRMITTNAGKTLAVSGSGRYLGYSSSSKSMAVPGSARSFFSSSRFDQSQRKMYVKQVTGKHNDTELHLLAKRGDLEEVNQILEEIEAQMTGTENGADFDFELEEIRTAIVNEVNELGETPLYTAAEKGHIDVVKALLPHMTSEGISSKNQAGLDAFHVAAAQGHEGI